MECSLLGVTGKGRTIDEALASLDYAVHVYMSRHTVNLPAPPKQKPREFAGGTFESA